MNVRIGEAGKTYGSQYIMGQGETANRERWLLEVAADGK